MMSLSADEAFAALGIEPTLDGARLKRAYFEAVGRTPPHRDAEAFRRVRAAYEALSRPGGIEAAYLSAAGASEREIAVVRARYAPLLAEARERIRARRAEQQRVPAFIEAASSSTLAAFCQRLSGTQT